MILTEKLMIIFLLCKVHVGFVLGEQVMGVHVHNVYIINACYVKSDYTFYFPFPGKMMTRDISRMCYVKSLNLIR
jgi:hypothetical protein